jgi:hypothetical protein
MLRASPLIFSGRAADYYELTTKFDQLPLGFTILPPDLNTFSKAALRDLAAALQISYYLDTFKADSYRL